MILKDIQKINIAFREFLINFKKRWWIFVVLFAYFIMFSELMPRFPSVGAFLLGFAFGGFCVGVERKQNSGSNLVLWNWIYLFLSFPAFAIAWSDLFTPGLIQRTSLYLILGISLILASGFFSTKAYLDEQLSLRERLFIFFLPVICGGFHGLAAISIAAKSYGMISISFWWIPLLFLVAGLLSSLVACIFGLLSGRSPMDYSPPPKHMTG